MISKLDFYIFKRSLIGLMIAILGVSIAIIMVDLVEQMRAVAGIKNAGFAVASHFTLMRLPGLIEQTVPITILISAIVTFTGLSRKSEIIAMRAAGISAWRFLAPMGTLAVLLSLVILFIIGPLASNLNRQYTLEKENLTSSLQSTGPNKATNNWANVPIKDGQIIINAPKFKQTNDGKVYSDATLFIYGSNGLKFVERLDAKTVIIGPKQLLLKDATISRSGEATSFTASRIYELAKAFSSKESMEARDLNLWQLPRAAMAAKASLGTQEKYWLRFYRLISLPFMLVAMALFAGIMSIGLDRSGGKGRSIVIALGVGIAMFFSGDLTGILATSGVLSPMVAALGPSIIALCLTLLFFSNREDGHAEQ